MYDCPPPLEPMPREVQRNNLTWTISARQKTTTRAIASQYVVTIGPTAMLLEGAGTVEMTNNRLISYSRIAYRSTFTPPYPWRLTGATTGDACVEDGTVVLLISEAPVRPSETVVVAFYYSADLAHAADVNQNGRVDGEDLGLMLMDFGTSALRSDLNQDGTVDGTDLGLFLSDFGYQPN